MKLRFARSTLVLFSLVASGLLAAAAGKAFAAACGDDVAGARVACSCGDTVVSDTKLDASDPVARERCDNDGLVVRAGPGAAAIQLDLAGLSLVGTGSGAGIRVLDGGDGGAVIAGGEPGRPGEIAGFRNGVRATRTHAVAEIRDLVIKGSTRDGLVLRGSEATLTRVSAEDNGRDGLRVGGRDHKLEGVEAAGNARYGVRVTARGAEGQASTAGNARGAMLAPAAGTDLKVEDGQR